jgi:hypothetical protein
MGYDLDAAGRVVGEALVQLSPTTYRLFAFLYENGEMPSGDTQNRPLMDT